MNFGTHERWSGPVSDALEPLPLRASTSRFEGRIWSVRTDEIAVGEAIVERDIVIHPGAVVVIALDDLDRVLLIRQYRHPVGALLFEPPAGLLDVAGESTLTSAKRELAEEAGYAAKTWNVLVDFFNSPGGSSEAIRVYLARDLHRLPEGRHVTGEAEEAWLPQVWVDLEQAKNLILAGSLGNPGAIVGVLAALAARTDSWVHLRAADAPWAAREHLLRNDRVQLGGE